MALLIAEIALFLFLALVFGFILGWWSRTLVARKQIQHLEETWKINLSSFDSRALPVADDPHQF